jgi:hypothetical protein
VRRIRADPPVSAIELPDRVVSSIAAEAKFCDMRSAFADLGITMLPSASCHAIATCALVQPCASAIAVSVGSASSSPP